MEFRIPGDEQKSTTFDLPSGYDDEMEAFISKTSGNEKDDFCPKWGYFQDSYPKWGVSKFYPKMGYFRGFRPKRELFMVIFLGSLHISRYI